MSPALARALLGLLPSLGLLAALVWLDGYRLVRLRTVLAVLAGGAAIAALTYPVNELLLDRLGLSVAAFSRWVAPASEELLKAALVVALVRAHRIGFLVDAAILGFAAGTGFALAENLYYLHLLPGEPLGTWAVRGLGTALMHGGCTAIVGVLGLAASERRPGAWARAFLPGLVLAALVHSAFNQFLLSPLVSTAGVVLLVPPLLHAVFARSEQALGEWLGRGFDADADKLELIGSGRFVDSPAGRYLQALRGRFDGPVVADLLCYLRLHLELSLRAKGMLLLRENGFEAPVDAATRETLGELKYLQRSLGRAGLRAVQPLLGMSGRELWQVYMLEG